MKPIINYHKVIKDIFLSQRHRAHKEKLFAFKFLPLCSLWALCEKKHYCETVNCQLSIAALLIGALLIPALASARVYSTLDDALKTAFPGSAIEKKNLYLTEEEKVRIESLAKLKLDSRLFAYYIGRDNGKVTGYAAVAGNIVRTKQAVTMVVLNTDKTLRSVDVLAFYEPEEYLPRAAWFRQFAGNTLSDRLRPGRDIHAVTGATLSVNSFTGEARKVLAVFQSAVN